MQINFLLEKIASWEGQLTLEDVWIESKFLETFNYTRGNIWKHNGI